MSSGEEVRERQERRGEEEGGCGSRGDEERQRTQTSRPDLYSTSKTFLGLTPGPTDCLLSLSFSLSLSRISTHGPVFPHTNAACIVYLLTHAYLSLRTLASLALGRVVIADYVCRFPNEDSAYIHTYIHTYFGLSSNLVRGGTEIQNSPSIGKRHFSRFSAERCNYTLHDLQHFGRNS